MGLIARFINWFFGADQRQFPNKVNGVGVEKIFVFAQGREATAGELASVVFNPRFKLEMPQNAKTGLPCSTEQWDLSPGETEAAAVERLARAMSARYPGLAVVALEWPDSQPTLIVVFVTESEFKSANSIRTRAIYSVRAAQQHP